MLRLLKTFTLVSLFVLTAFAETPKVGDRAPEFSLPSHTGKQVALKDYAGKAKLVLVFYRGSW